MHRHIRSVDDLLTSVNDAPTLTGHIARRLERPPPDPRAVEPTVPESLALVIRTALA